MEIVAAWLLLSLIPAYIAHQKGLEPVTWFLHGVLLTPVIAALLAMRAEPGSEVIDLPPE